MASKTVANGDTMGPDTEIIRLDEFAAQTTGLTDIYKSLLIEAATYLLQWPMSTPHQQLFVRGSVDHDHQLQLDSTTEAMATTYNDVAQATEWAACALALLVSYRHYGLVCQRRSAKGTGFDYHLAPHTLFSKDNFLLGVRMESSGILSGTDRDIERRMKLKEKQTSSGQSRSQGLLPDSLIICISLLSAPSVTVQTSGSFFNKDDQL